MKLSSSYDQVSTPSQVRLYDEIRLLNQARADTWRAAASEIRSGIPDKKIRGCEQAIKMMHLLATVCEQHADALDRQDITDWLRRELALVDSAKSVDNASVSGGTQTADPQDSK